MDEDDRPIHLKHFIVVKELNDYNRYLNIVHTALV
jgi:hypothetical protein